MRRKTCFLTVLALLLVLNTGIGSAWGYFTTYAAAQGGCIIELGDREEIKEEFSDWTKHVVVTSEAGSEPVYIRAKAFGPSKYALTYSDAGGKWAPGPDGYYYYSDIVNGGESTEELLVRISGVPADAALQEGENFNVIVIYESIPVQYQADGTPIPAAEMDWSQKLDSGRSEGGAES